MTLPDDRASDEISLPETDLPVETGAATVSDVPTHGFSAEEIAEIERSYSPDPELKALRAQRAEIGATFARNRAEEPELILAWQERQDPRAIAKLLERYAPMVNGAIAKTLAGRAINTGHAEDLRQEARLAFIKAVDRFDLSMNTQLSSMAGIYIRTALLRYALDNRTSVRIGTTSSERVAYYKVQALRARKAATGSDILDEKDIALIQETTGISRRTTEIAISTVYAQSASIDDMAESLESEDAVEILQEEMSRKSAMDAIREILPSLKDRAREIVEATFLCEPPVPTQDLAERYGVSSERIGQIRREALTDLKIALKNRGIRAEACL